MNQDCAEMMLKKAAQLVLQQDLEFTYDREVSDAQIDLGPAFMFADDEQKKHWYSGASKELLEADLKTLDTNKVYFLRTGTNDGAGHWQTLYFDITRSGWVNYSSNKNNYLLTHDGKLTADGERLLSPYAKWGRNKGEYAFFLVEASSKNLIQASNFLYDFRMGGEDRAIEKSIEQREALYDEIQVKTHPPIEGSILVQADVRLDEEKVIDESKEQRETLYDEIQVKTHSPIQGSIVVQADVKLDEVVKEPEIETNPVAHKLISVEPNVDQDKEPATKLNRIITQLIANITTQNNGRKTTCNNDWKIKLFNNIQEQLKAKELSPSEVQKFVDDIRSVCSKRRNIFHFWAEPHSVQEFENLFKKEFPEEAAIRALRDPYQI